MKRTSTKPKKEVPRGDTLPAYIRDYIRINPDAQMKKTYKLIWRPKAPANYLIQGADLLQVAGASALTLDLIGATLDLTDLQVNNMGILNELKSLSIYYVKTIYGLDGLQNLQSLSLTKCGLTDLPELPRLRDLTVIACENLSLKTLDFPSLTRLELSTCSRTGGLILPDLSRFPMVTDLNLDLNGLKTLQKAVQTLPLQALSLVENFFKKIPLVLRSVPTLQRLNLASNEITEIPAWFSTLENLERLDLTDNKLTRLDRLGNLPRLIDLKVGGNLFREDALSDCFRTETAQEIRYLSLQENEIEQIPPEIVNCQQLEVLDLSFNPIKDLPAYLNDLPHLRVLYLLPSDNTNEMPIGTFPFQILTTRTEIWTYETDLSLSD